MNKIERELEFLKIKKHDVERAFKSQVDNHKHSAIYLVALVGVFSAITFSLGYTNSLSFVVFGEEGQVFANRVVER